MENIIKIDNLKKSFKMVKAVDGLSFRVKKGELFAFLGLNGAGKSTTISVMCGRLQKDEGSVIIDGVDVDKHADKIKSEVGVVFQNSVLDKSLSVIDNLKSRASLYGIEGKEFDKVLDKLCAELDLKDILKRTVGKLSGGQRRRVDVARALLSSPKILILDEPTTGLDPQTRKTLWEVVERLRKETGMTVFLTTHYMEEAADADYVVIIDSGKISAEGTPIELKNKYASDSVIVYTDDEDGVKALGKEYEKVGFGYKIKVKNTEEVTEMILANPAFFKDYEVLKGKMDDVFLTVTGKKLVGGEAK